MNDFCKGCKNYSTNNGKMRMDQPVRDGKFCTKFNWNLERVKTWVQKISDQKGDKLPVMKLIPGDCYE